MRRQQLRPSALPRVGYLTNAPPYIGRGAMASQLETSRTDPGPGKRAELLGDMDNFSEEDDDGEASEEEAQMAACYCFGGPTLNAFCMAPDLVSPNSEPVEVDYDREYAILEAAHTLISEKQD